VRHEGEGMQQRTRPGGGGGARSSSSRAGGARTGGSARAGNGAVRSGGVARAGQPRTADRGRAPERARSAESRPTTPTRRAQTGTAKRTRAPEPRRYTGRAAVLGLVLLCLLLAYAYPVREYLSQQAEISALQSSQANQQEKIQQLKEHAAKWNDPEYVISIARQRLHMTLPGEKTYVVIDPSRATSADGGTTPATPPAKRPWYGKLWSSVEAADQK
jgi:cell division protein FtsB